MVSQHANGCYTLDAPVPGNSFVFDIYNDGQAPRATAPALPGGPCNYTDQTLPRCGCRRFWSRPPVSSVFQDSTVPNLSEICMCSHHACFHEDAQPGQTQPMPVTSVAGQENQKPRANREPLSPVPGVPSFHMPSNLGLSLDFNMLGFQTSVSAPHKDAIDTLPAEDARAGQDSPMPDTFNSWGDIFETQAAPANGPPSNPAQCIMSSQPPSTAASSQARYLRPFAGKGLQTLSGGSVVAAQARSAGRSDQDGNAGAIRDMIPPSGDFPCRDAGDATPRPAHSQARSAAASYLGSYQKLADTVEAHEQRLERLESASFSIAGHDDCNDKHEHTDLRVTELESRVEEVEKILNDSSSIASSKRTVRNDGAADDATASVASVSTNATVLASNRAEVYSQLRILQAQVSQLQEAALPSYTKPWELEVVFLPFPLKGIWMDAREFSAQRRSTGSNVGEWTQMPNTISRATPDPQSPKFMEWVGQGPESNWLLPRAFASGRTIDQRLKSRGLIKTVLVRGPDARSVHLAIHNAFYDILRISSNSDALSGYAPPDSPLSEYLGLRQAWVPLRKLHKDSRLRFLSPAEMATPALWDFTFLVSSVVMKATGLQRLYITQPEAYLQDHPLGYHAFESGWNWQKLRELSRVYPDSQSSAGDVPEADAMEECWAWDERLDGEPSVNTSIMSLCQSHQQRVSKRSSTEPSAQFFTGVQSPILTSNPGFSRAQSPLIQRDRKGSWPPHIRAGSLPPVAPTLLSPAQSRRRVSSHTASATPYERRSSPFIPRPSPRLNSHPNMAANTSAATIPKRRFGTRSPSLAPRNTPRWSRTSMSRSPSLAPGGPYGYHDEAPNRERRTTPFYYATPHSDAHPDQPYGYLRAGSRGPTPGPAGLRIGGYGDGGDDDEDMNDGDYEDDERGSSTDPYDSEMTSDDHVDQYNHNHSHSHRRRNKHNNSFGFGRDADGADLDIDVYEDEEDGEDYEKEDELDGVDTDGGDGQTAAWHGLGRQPQQHQVQQQVPSFPHGQHVQQGASLAQPRPEDIPWAGIEDHMSDGENVDPSESSSFSSQSLSQSQSQSQLQSQEIEIHENDDDDDEDDDCGQRQRQRQQSTLPDADAEDDAENDDDDTTSASASSQAPSEYSSKPGPWQVIPLLPPPSSSTVDVDVDDEEVGQGQHPKQTAAAIAIATTESQSQEEEESMEFRIHEDGTAGGGEGGDGGAGLLLDTQWA